MDYKKLNSRTQRDHFPIPFIEQMLDRLEGSSWYYLLDGYLGYDQISIAPEDRDRLYLHSPMIQLPSSVCPSGNVMLLQYSKAV